MRRSIALALLVVVPHFSRADEIDDFVEAQIKAKKVPGLALAVVHEGKVVKSKGYGFASLELKAPATDETVFEIGSVTKMFTATLAMMLVEDEKLALDDQISKHITDLPDAWKGVTVRHLLNHTSGIKSYTGVADFVTLARTDHTPESILKMVRDKPLEFEPGASWAYNNTGYYLLGMVVEKAGGKPFAAQLDERIFKPLGMTHTRPNNPKAIIPGRAEGYGEVFGVVVNRDPLTPSAAFSAGFLISTVGDLVKWDAALAEGKLLKKSSYDQMYELTRLRDGSTRPYGFGWATRRRLGHPIRGHGGGTTGFSSDITRYIDETLTTIVLTNLGGAGADDIGRGVARIVLPSLSLTKVPAIEDDDADLTESIKSAFRDTLAGDVENDLFLDAFAKHLAKPETKALMKAVATAGDLGEFALIGQEKEDKARTRYYRVRIGSKLGTLTVQVGDDGKVGGWLLEPEE